MLIAHERLHHTPVMSLQTGGRLAQTARAVIDPRNLSVMAYELEGPSLDHRSSFLLISDVRELSNLGLIIDSNDEFVSPDDIIRLREVLDFQFELLGKKVVDESNHTLGKVSGYSVEPQSFLIKQLSVKRPLLKSFSDTELLIDRTQIAEITDTTITIKHDEREPAPVKAAARVYTNPFRGQTPQPEAIDRQDQ